MGRDHGDLFKSEMRSDSTSGKIEKSEGDKMETENLTVHMKQIQNDYFDAMITAENIICKIKQLSKAKKSQVQSIKAEIINMFGKYNIPCEKFESEEEYIRVLNNNYQKILKFSDISCHILKLMYSHFMEYPSPADYMNRIVNRLSDPADGWENDTLRLRILKQFIKYGNFLTYKREVSDEEWDPFLKNGGQRKTEKISVYNGELFIKTYIRYKLGKDTVTTDEILDNLDDEIFDCLKDATKEQKQSDGKYGLINLANDLAYGRFKSGGSTRHGLYLFAIVFNMTYNCKNNDSVLNYNPNSDIEKNLFRDYYTSNLMRFFKTQDTNKQAEFVCEPSGQGINYKNFAEMIYIYFISKDLEPTEKLRKADEMIKRVIKNQKNSGIQTTVTGSTTSYISSFNEKLFNMNEEEFEAAILEKYDCSLVKKDKDGKNEKILNPFQVQDSQRTAYNKYIKMKDVLVTDDDKLINNDNYGIWFADVCAIDRYGSSGIKKILSDESDDKNDERIDQFIDLIKRIHRIIGVSLKELQSTSEGKKEHPDPSTQVPRSLKIDNEKDMTRTALITAFYYYYNSRDIDEYCVGKTLSDVFDDYRSELDPILESANFQPISEKNIFDITVVFSSYAYFNC